jgi:hypothetical protein
MFLATINVADITSFIWQQQLLSLTQLVLFLQQKLLSLA